MANPTPSLSLRSVLEKDKLTDNNFVDWFRNLRIVLKHERKAYVLDGPLPPEPPANAHRTVRDAHQKHIDDNLDVSCIMLATMSPELQKAHVDLTSGYEIAQRLKELYEIQGRQERFDTSKALFSSKMTKKGKVGPHVINMIGYVERLEKMGYPLGKQLATDLILQSLPDKFSHFVMNYYMNEIDKPLGSLLNMLRTAELNMKEQPEQVLVVQNVKGKGKGKAKGKMFDSSAKAKGKGKLMPKGGIVKKGVCHHCGIKGHWRRNCPQYLASGKTQKKGGEASTSGNPNA